MAISSVAQLNALKDKRPRGGVIGIHIIHSGRVVKAESVLYGSPTEKDEEGMIMPVVVLDHVDYVLPIN